MADGGSSSWPTHDRAAPITATVAARAPTAPTTAPTDMRTAPPTSSPRLISILRSPVRGVMASSLGGRAFAGTRPCSRVDRGGHHRCFGPPGRGGVIPFELAGDDSAPAAAGEPAGCGGPRPPDA